MIKAIIFDFFGVICSDEYWRIVKTDRNITSDFSEMADSVNLGTISWQEFVNQIAKRTGGSALEIEKAYKSEKIDINVLSYIGNLHKKYKTALISNASYEFFEPKAKEIGFTKFFDYTIVSSRLGIIKPDSKIYEHVLKKLGVTAQESVYIDDIKRYVEAAQRLGMGGIVYRNFTQMKQELEELLSAVSDD